MGDSVNSGFVNVVGWGITVVLIVLTAALIVTTIFPDLI
jgi:Mn2+/Fe2+ NRAMP family transporter